MCLSAVLLSSIGLGCQPYDKPEYSEIDTAESAYVVPLEDNTGKQDKFDSVKFLEERKVSVKRIQIPHRWSQEGRGFGNGKWIPTVKVIKVNRSPITREWTAEGTTGSADKNQAIWVESADSVGFSMGFSTTGYIKDEDTSTFLFWYPAGSLEKVMDFEVRARVQQAVAEVAAKYPLDQLRTKKQDMVDAARKDVIAFFGQRGITITTVAMFGGMTYENPQIQAAIDKTFIAQQEKVVNLARFEAQQKENDRMELEANAIAEKARREAKGEADAKLMLYQAEAAGIKAVNDSLAGANPLVLTMKGLEIEKERVTRWDGKFPVYYMGQSLSGSSPTLLMQVPEVGYKSTTQPVK